MGRLIKWLLLIVVIAVIGASIYFAVAETPLEQTVVEQPVDRETLGI